MKFSDYSDDDFKDAKDGAEMKRESSKIYTPELIEELEEVFHDAHDHFMQNTVMPRMSIRRIAGNMDSY